MKYWIPLGLVVLTAGLMAASDSSVHAPPASCMPTVRDYTYMWWANGFGKAAEGKPQILCIRTGWYGLAIDVKGVKLLHFGAIEKVTPYLAAGNEDNDVVFGLPAEDLRLIVKVGKSEYRCVRGAVDQKDTADFPARIIESGRVVQRCDIKQLEFENAKGERLKATGRLEVEAWADRVCFTLEVTPEMDLADAGLWILASGGIATEVTGDTRSPKRPSSGLRMLQTYRVRLCQSFGSEVVLSGGKVAVQVRRVTGGQEDALDVTYNEGTGVHRVVLPRLQFSVAEEPDRLARFAVILANESAKERVFRLVFDSEDGTPGITGVSAMLRDANGDPTGIPVQVSKNWHKRAGRTFLYEGPWVHASTMVRVPARASTKLEYAMAWARWGGVPAASHAQLSLIGWGHNQLWDEAAIGSWGESICYEPDVANGRSMIDDIRPLMVWQMNGQQKEWGWTNNVGGGDFLVYCDGQNRRQPLVRMRTAYLAQCPNLTEVVYSGVTADGMIAAKMTVSSPRCDDINRAYHRFRYDVLKPTPFTRLAFYQLGSDGYNDQQFKKLARGNVEGLAEEWTFAQGGRRYDRVGMKCEGAQPWFSLHEAVNQDTKGGAWANRGLVMRSWKARLGGREVATPFASCYGTENGRPGMNVELSAPAELKQLEAGDFVEAEVELLVMPMSAGDYYGPNGNLRESLKADGNTWKPIWRQARGNYLEFKAAKGRIARAYPPVVEVNEEQAAEVQITGGVGYVPVSFGGLKDYTGYEVEMAVDGQTGKVDQAVHGSDFWQADYDAEQRTWTITYNVTLDSPGDRRRTVRLSFGKPGRKP